METAKLATAGWLARRWRVTLWIWRLTLVALVAGLAVINATGVYAQLAAAHVGERGAATSAIETQDAALAARIEVTSHTVADLDRRLGQIDTAIEEAAKRGRTVTALTILCSVSPLGSTLQAGGCSGHRRDRAAPELFSMVGPRGDVRSALKGGIDDPCKGANAIKPMQLEMKRRFCYSEAALVGLPASAGTSASISLRIAALRLRMRVSSPDS